MITPAEEQQAEILGKAMRFGAMLWLSEGNDPGELRWFPKKKVLELRLSSHSAPLFGEVVQSRFQSLAASLQAETVIKRL